MRPNPRPSHAPAQKASRRRFLATGGKLAATTALAGAAVPHVHAAEDNTIRLALVGCGGRGSGAVGNAMSVPDSGPIKLYAMADVFEDRITRAHKALSKAFADRVDVPPSAASSASTPTARPSTLCVPATWPC